MRKVIPALAATAALALLGACGGSGDQAATTTEAGGSGGSGSDDGGAIKIMSPKDGADVTSPVTLKFDAGDIGPTDSGKDHVHIFVDGKETDYTVVTKSPFKVTGLSKGKHTINITKQHADHSPAGPKADITVNVTGGSTSGGDKSDTSDKSDSDNGGYDY
jgi:hypothetical protein